MDAVIEMDFTTNVRHYLACVRAGAAVVVYGMGAREATLPTYWFMRNRIRVEHLFVYDMDPDERDLCHKEIGALLVGGGLRHSGALRLPLADIARAHDLVEQGRVLGHVVLDI